jgi:hypothetical protein
VQATEVLLATTNFTAKSVPLLPGCVVVATHDADGDLDGLSWQQLEHLVRQNRSLTTRELRVLDKRIQRHNRRQARPVRPAAVTPLPAATSRTPVKRTAKAAS